MSRSAEEVPSRTEVEARLMERAWQDQAEGRMLILLGIPFALAGIGFLSGALWMLLWLLGMGMNAAFLVALALVLAVAAWDTWRHPSESWVKAKYTLTDGRTADPDRDAYDLETGMPLMMNAGDPANWMTRGSVIANGCANLVLAGPRNIRAGVEKLKIAKRRRDPANAARAHAFLEWFVPQAPMPEPDLFRDIGDRGSGYLLAEELGFIGRRTEGGRRSVFVRGGSAGPSDEP